MLYELSSRLPSGHQRQMFRGVCLLYGLCAPFYFDEADCCGYTEPTDCKALPYMVAVGMLVGRIGPPAVLAARPSGM